jgi:hypothetical protein
VVAIAAPPGSRLEPIMLKVIEDKRRREMIGWLASGAAALITGAWAIYVHFAPAEQPNPNATVNVRDCSIAIVGSATGRDFTAGNCAASWHS